MTRPTLSPLERLVRSVLWKPLAASKRIRRLVFDSAPEDHLFVCDGMNETFVVSARDLAIGRDLFVLRKCDFEKVKHAKHILESRAFGFSLLVDIGANIGTICIPAVKRGFFKRAIAIEPEPFNFSLLETNIRLNNLTEKIKTHNMALGMNEREVLEFELSGTNYGDHRIKVRGDSGLYDEDNRSSIEVKSDTLDHAIGEIDPRDSLIWMDTQGYEGFVLAGAKRALSVKTPLVIEFWPYGLARSGSYVQLKESLSSSGHRCFYDLSGSDTATPLSVDSLDSLYGRLGNRGAFTDLLIL